MNMILTGPRLAAKAAQWSNLIFANMKQTSHGELVYSESDLCNLIMQGCAIDDVTVDQSVNLESAAAILNDIPKFIAYNELVEQLSTEQFDHRNQQQWFMPESYRNMDIAELVLNLCATDAELQRCGHELMLFQERGLFDLLRYLKYLVDVMSEHKLIWGVGRGSSVASYVLYKLGVHRIDSLYYDLDPAEFLR
jgi:DNA polymerase III alpha subunit